jgi:GDP-mannose transporter
MIYTSTWALKFLSIPVYTIFKNLTIIIIAYGEVLWFGGSVTPMALFSFGLMVLSSIVAAWADIQHALSFGEQTEAATEAMSTLNAGYLWMMFNCLCTAAYILSMRKRIKLFNFKDFDSKLFTALNLTLSLISSSYVLQQPAHHPRLARCFIAGRRLVLGQPIQVLSR